MARAPRGPTGTVRGLDAQSVTDTLAALLGQLGPHFERAEAAAWLRRYRQGIGTDVVEALLHALGKVPGVTAVTGEARYEAPESLLMPAFIRNRTWRIALPNADIADAVALVDILTTSAADCTPNLHHLRRRLNKALGGIL